jgi:hypothetical protein
MGALAGADAGGAFGAGVFFTKEPVSYPQMGDSSNYNEYGYGLLNL